MKRYFEKSFDIFRFNIYRSGVMTENMKNTAIFSDKKMALCFA